MANLTDTLLRLQSPVGEYLSQYGASKERQMVEEQRKAAIAMQKLDYDLRSQMEQRRQAAAEKEATLAKQANSLKANQAYLPKIYEAAYQGITDPNAFMSIWAGTAQMFGLDPITDKPLVSPEEIAMTVKKAQGQRVLDEAEAARKSIPKKPEYIHHEDKGQVIWEKYDPATGEVTPAGTSPKFKASGGGGGEANKYPLLAKYGLTVPEARMAYNRMVTAATQAGEDVIDFPTFAGLIDRYRGENPELFPVKEVEQTGAAINTFLSDVATGKRQAPMEYYDENGNLDLAALRADAESGRLAVPRTTPTGLSLVGGGQGEAPAQKKLTDPAIAKKYLEQAGGNKDKARQLAAQDGWIF
jgi:hypothetical protein